MEQPEARGVFANGLTLFKVDLMIREFQVRKTWATQICLQKWGTDVRIRVQARKEGGGQNPSEEQLNDVETSRRFEYTTSDDVMAAFNAGEEVRLQFGFALLI